MTGTATYQTSSDEFFKGEFLNGMMHGLGVLTYKNGDKFHGSWHYNHRHGPGTLILADGTTESIMYKDGVLESSGEAVVGN